MRAEHLAIDGALVSFEGSANLSQRTTATGWAMVPSLLRIYPFTTYPAGHTRTAEESVRRQFPELRISQTQEYSLKNGWLRTATVELPAATGGTRTLTVGGWEGNNGCLSTSIVGDDGNRLIEMFDTLKFTDTPRGIAINSPVSVTPRAPQIVKEIPGVGILAVRPAIASELERVPRERGFQLPHAELFRTGSKGRTLLLVTRSAVSSVTLLTEGEPLNTVRDLRIEWKPPARPASR